MVELQCVAQSSFMAQQISLGEQNFRRRPDFDLSELSL
jgi:hypothetical protein